MKLAADERRSQILNEATRLFGRDGFDKTTTKGLAAACGISEPALYRYFASKENLYDSVLESLESRLTCAELFTDLRDENDLGTILQRVAEHILTYARRHHDLYRLLFYSALGGHPKARQVQQTIRSRHVKFLHRQLDRLERLGLIARRNNEITARCFIGMVFDCALGGTLWRNPRGRASTAEEVIANNISIFADGLRRSGGRRPDLTEDRNGE